MKPTEKCYGVTEAMLDDLERWSRPLETCRAYDGDNEYKNAFEACRSREIPDWDFTKIKAAVEAMRKFIVQHGYVRTENGRQVFHVYGDQRDNVIRALFELRYPGQDPVGQPSDKE